MNYGRDNIINIEILKQFLDDSYNRLSNKSLEKCKKYGAVSDKQLLKDDLKSENYSITELDLCLISLNDEFNIGFILLSDKKSDKLEIILNLIKKILVNILFYLIIILKHKMISKKVILN